MTVTVCADVMLEGAVYTPPVEIDPTAGVTLHVTPILAVFATEAANV